jgi:hypothetical protein
MVKKIQTFFKNVWFFRKQLSKFQWWDYSFTLYLMERSFESMENGLRDKGQEVHESRIKKVMAIARARQIIKNIQEDNFSQEAEKRLGKKIISKDITWEKIDDDKFRLISNTTPQEDAINKEIFDLSNRIEYEEWCEFCRILQGQNPDDYKPNDEDKDWEDWFDGTGMKGWWD